MKSSESPVLIVAVLNVRIRRIQDTHQIESSEIPGALQCNTGGFLAIMSWFVRQGMSVIIQTEGIVTIVHIDMG